MSAAAPNPPPVPGGNPSPPVNRPAQIALVVLVVGMIGLLAVRGYGNRLSTHPADLTRVTRVNLNQADTSELEQIPGVGPKHAQAIAEHRREKGPFASVDGLREVHGFGPATVENVRRYVRVDDELPPSDVELPKLDRKASPGGTPTSRSGSTKKLKPGDGPVNVNAASAEELQRLPGIGPEFARKIIEARPFRAIDDLRRVKGIGPKTMETLRPFVVAQ